MFLIKRMFSFILVAAACLTGYPNASANQDYFSRPSLRGLQGVEVYIEGIGPEAEQEGLTRDKIQAEIEQRLRQSGITVIYTHESHKTPGAPYLHLDLDLKKDLQMDQYVYSIKAELKQLVTLTRNPNIMVNGTTWSTPREHGTTTTPGLGKIQNSIYNHVDMFIDAYRTVN